MDNNQQQPVQQPQQPVETPPQEETDQQQSTQPPPYNSTKVILGVIGFVVAFIIVGVGYFYILNTLQMNNLAPIPNQTTALNTATATPLPSETPTPSPTVQPNQSNEKRKKDLLTIQEGIFKYKTAKGSLPPQITTTAQAVAKEGSDICPALVPEFIPALPKDPLSEENLDAPIGAVKDCSTLYITGYVIAKDAKGTVTITAPFAQEETIMVKF
jgi:hypothetical protein